MTHKALCAPKRQSDMETIASLVASQQATAEKNELFSLQSYFVKFA